MRKTLKEIAELVGGEVVGDGDLVITGVCGIKEAEEGDITFLANPKYASYMEKTRASAIITGRDTPKAAKPIIRTDNPSVAFAKVLSAAVPFETAHPRGIHPSAVIAQGASLAKGVAVGAHAVIEDGASVGEGTVIYAGCYVGRDTAIGADCVIYPRVSIRERVVIGSRVVIQSGTVIGSDGFGFATIDGVHRRIPQIGTVVVEDDVEIGANVTIDRARFDKTIIGRGTKIDNLVHIAHNVVIGENSIIVAQAGISGSTVIGKGVTLAGQAGLVGHITIGDGAVVAAQAGVTKSVPPKTTVSGYPARPHDEARRSYAYVQGLPKLHQTVAELKKRIEELEARLGKKP